jgi:hypothetical protein
VDYRCELKPQPPLPTRSSRRRSAVLRRWKRGTVDFAMCSTHKFVSAAAVLTLVDQGHMSLDKRVPYMRADLLDYAPINQGTCRRWFHDGGWPLCRRDRLERQHGGSDCSTVHRLDPLCSLARGHHLPARPYRAGLEHRDRRRSSHHNSRRGCTPISRMAGRSATSRDRAIMGPEMTSGSSSRLGAPRSSQPFTAPNPPSLCHPASKSSLR